jgi:hypothetical protein
VFFTGGRIKSSLGCKSLVVNELFDCGCEVVFWEVGFMGEAGGFVLLALIAARAISPIATVIAPIRP